MEQVPESEFQKYVDIVDQEFLNIGYLKFRAIESKVFQEEQLLIRGDKIAVDIPLLSEPAFNQWVNSFRLDSDWNDYYYLNSQKSTELANELKTKFHREFGITPQQLARFEIGLVKTARSQGKEEGNFPLLYIPDKLLSSMLSIMKKEQEVDERSARDFLTELEYAPWRQWAESPLVKVSVGNTIRYTPILPSMFINWIISAAWLERFKKSPRGSRLQGMINKDWGGLFENYVRATLSEHHDNLIVNQGCLKIRKKKYPDLIDCTSNQRPEIDVVAQTEKCVYLISCKAMDESISSKLFLRFYLQDYVSFRNNIELDMKHAGQISQVADCIKKSPSFLEDRGFVGKKIVPLLVTSDTRPLSIQSVQKWCIENKLIHTLPEAKIIQARGLKDITFE